MSKFTFKKYPRATGLAGVAEAGREYYDIKLKGIYVGIFGKNHSNEKFDIRFQIIKKDIMEDGNPNCEWKWITLKYKTSSSQEAKDFLIKFSEEIQKKFNLYIDKS
jgi:hypothetical protein